MVQAFPRDCGWCEWPDGHLTVRIFYSGDYRDKKPDFKPWCIFSVWGWDDTGMEINEYVADDKEANELINKWLEIYHDMPKHLSMEWLEERGFQPA
jgi:hypothetical protein